MKARLFLFRQIPEGCEDPAFSHRAHCLASQRFHLFCRTGRNAVCLFFDFCKKSPGKPFPELSFFFIHHNLHAVQSDPSCQDDLLPGPHTFVHLFFCPPDIQKTLSGAAAYDAFACAVAALICDALCVEIALLTSADLLGSSDFVPTRMI